MSESNAELVEELKSQIALEKEKIQAKEVVLLSLLEELDKLREE